MWPEAQKAGRKNNVALLPFLAAVLVYVSAAAQENQVFDQNKIVRYDKRLKFYLDEKTKDYLIEMAAGERMLLENIKNLTTEIKQRGVSGSAKDDAGFHTLYGEMQSLTQDYAAELDAILAILEEIQALSQTLEQGKQDSALVEQIADLRENLLSLLESRDLYKKAPRTGSYKAGLVREYNVEVDSVLRIYDRLERFERTALARRDTAAANATRLQKQKLGSLLAEMKSGDKTAPLISPDLLNEVNQFLNLLDELNRLDHTAAPSLDAKIEAETLRRQILARLDKNLLGLFGYPELDPANARTLDQVFQNWRAERLADFEVRRTQYALIKKNLLRNGSVKERSRMLNRDLSDALLNYASEQYLLAEMQLGALMQEYGPYFTNWDAAKFYRIECLYARAVLPEAFQAYEQLLRESPDSRLHGMMLLRLLGIAHRLGWSEAFFDYYGQLEAEAPRIEAKIVEQARYLAGYYGLNLGKLNEAETALAKIPAGSKYDLAARYLRGLVHLNRGDLFSALPLFNEVAGVETLPWSDPASAMIRNNALLKLGFIYYERGDYRMALKYFDRVSQGAENYDLSLLGKAWAQLKQGNPGYSIAETQALIQGYLVSNYTYEALVLSAHCKRLLDQPEAAMRDLRYVTSAHGVLELSRDYNEERARLAAQMNELDRMEREALERQDAPLYEIVVKVKQTLQATLLNYNYRGPRGNLKIEEFGEERQKIYTQIRQLDGIIAEAQTLALEDVVQDAVSRRNRLVKALETYQADQSLQTINYLVEYPLAVKESGAEYRKEVMANLLAHLENEQERLTASMATARELAALKESQPAKYALELEMLEADLKNLRQRMDRFQSWLAQFQVDEPQTNFDQWANLSGFGLSDLAFQELEKRERKIDEYSQHLVSIDKMLRTRQLDLQMRLKNFDAEVRRLEEELIEEQVRLDKLEHQKYFERAYFDTSQSEVITEKREAPEVEVQEIEPPQ